MQLSAQKRDPTSTAVLSIRCAYLNSSDEQRLETKASDSDSDSDSDSEHKKFRSNYIASKATLFPERMEPGWRNDT